MRCKNLWKNGTGWSMYRATRMRGCSWSWKERRYENSTIRKNNGYSVKSCLSEHVGTVLSSSSVTLKVNMEDNCCLLQTNQPCEQRGRHNSLTYALLYDSQAEKLVRLTNVLRTEPDNWHSTALTFIALQLLSFYMSRQPLAASSITRWFFPCLVLT